MEKAFVITAKQIDSNWLIIESTTLRGAKLTATNHYREHGQITGAIRVGEILESGEIVEVAARINGKWKAIQ